MNNYEIINRISSSKWNSFLLKKEELEEYLIDGKPVPDGGLFSRFSEKTKENNKRRNDRMVELLNMRTCSIGEDYIKDNICKPEKEIISMIIEPTKNILWGRSISHIFKGEKSETDPITIKLRNLTTEGHKYSGEIVDVFSIPAPKTMLANGIEKKVLFITTKGICFIEIKDSDMTRLAPMAVFNAIGPGLGALATGISVAATKFIAHSVDNYQMDKEQQKIVELALKYSPSLTASCFESGQFIPYGVINSIVYGEQTKRETYMIDCIYQNMSKRVFFEVNKEVMLRIIKKLSGDNPPEIKN